MASITLARYQRPAVVLSMAALLLFFAAHRILSFAETEMHIDEIWSVWQTLGTPGQIINWTPFDWTPLGYLAIGAWRGAVGMHPIVLRVLPMLLFLISAALLYRVGRRITGDHRTALLIVLVYGAFGYTVRASTEIRGYMLALMLIIAIWWMMLRYVQRPSLLKAILCAVLIAASFYAYMPSAIGWLAIGLYLLATYRGQAFRVWLPTLMAILLILPGIFWRWRAVTDRVAYVWQSTGTFFEMVLENFNTFAVYRYIGSPVGFWYVVFILAVILLILMWVRDRHHRRHLSGVAAWAIVLPCVLFIIHTRTDFFRLHYAMMWLIGLVFFMGWGLARLGSLHRFLYWGSIAAVVIVMLVPTQLSYYAGYWRPWMTNLTWLRERYRPDDAVVIDPNCCLGHRYEWDYMVPLYFPDGLNIQTEPEDARRVWYVTYEGQQDLALEADIRDGRIARSFVGPAEFLFRLYEAPPDREGLAFENGLRFHGFDVMHGDGEHTESPRVLVRREGETVRLRLWWSADFTPALDYSVGIYLLGEDGRVVVQSDGAPQLAAMAYPPDTASPETNQWEPGRYYVEERTLTLPTNMEFETLTMTLAVYDWRNGERVAAPRLRDDSLLELFKMRVESWTGRSVQG